MNIKHVWFKPFLLVLLLLFFTKLVAEEKVDIFDFEAIIRDDAVILTWQTNIKTEKLLLYRSTSPFVSIHSLSQAVLVSSTLDSTAPFVDYPIPGIPNYYAIIDSQNLALGEINFVPNKNTNRVPVEISHLFSYMPKQKIMYQRPLPLPRLNLNNQVQSQVGFFSQGTEQKLQNFLQSYIIPSKLYKHFEILLDDTDKTLGGEYLILRNIIEGSIHKKDWEQAQNELKDFLSLRRTPESRARAHFYLGQVYYFSNSFDKALLEFLLVQEAYYDISQKWIQFTLKELANNPN